MDDKQSLSGKSRLLFGKLFVDEVTSHEPVINLSTDRNLTEQDISSAVDKHKIILLPGVEGSCAVMKSLASNLKGDVYCIQYTVQTPMTAADMIEYSNQLVKSIVGNKSTFTLVGYSYGGWLAMEACHLMEQREGKIGNLILIDSSPEFLKAAASIWYKDKNEDELQVYVLTHFLKLMTPEMWEKAETKFRELKTFETRINLALSITAVEKDYSDTYKRLIIRGMYHRAKALDQTKPFPEKCLTSAVTLIKPSKSKMKFADYGLFKYCTEPVDIYEVDGNHFSILQDDKLSDIITRKVSRLIEKSS